MRPHKGEAIAVAIIRHKTMARGAMAFAWRFARFEAAKAKSLGERGAALVEFGLLAPVLLLILLGTAQFGLTLNQYVMLTNAVGVGAMQFAVSRSDTTPSQDAWKAITAAASTLTPANLPITLSVNGTACVTNATTLGAAASGDAACAAALTNNVGQPAQASATYPCILKVMWYNFAPTCNLTQQVTERVQ